MRCVRESFFAVFLAFAIAGPACGAAGAEESEPGILGTIKAVKGEAIVLDLGSGDGVAPKMEFSVFSTAKVVKLPFTGKPVLIRERKIATLIVTSVAEETANARIHWIREGETLEAGMSVAQVPKVLEKRPNAPPEVKLVVESKDIYSGAQVQLRADIQDLDDKFHFFRWSCTGGYFMMKETVEARNIWIPPVAPGDYTLTVRATDPKKAKGTDSVKVFSVGFPRAEKLQMGPAGAFGYESRRFGVATDLVFSEDGSLILLDSANRCLGLLSADFKVKRVGVPFGDDQEFSRVAVRCGIIAAIDPDEYRVSVFDYKSSLDLTAPRHAFGSYGYTNGCFQKPVDLVIMKTSEIVVLDRKAKRMQAFDRKGRFAFSVGMEGEEEYQLKDPVGLCLDATDALYVLDAGNLKVQRYVDFRHEREIKLEEEDVKEPCAIAYNPRTKLLQILDAADGSVKAYSLSGKKQDFIFNESPAALAVPENPTRIHCDVFGNIYLTVQEDAALLKYSWSGKFLGKWGGEETNRAIRAAAGPNGEMYLLAPSTGWLFSDRSRNCIWKLDQNGWIVQRISGPGTEAVFDEAVDFVCSPDGHLFVLDVGAGIVAHIMPDGTRATDIGENVFEDPIDIAAGPGGFAVLLYKTRECVHLFDYKGNPAGSPIPPADGEVETYKPHRVACGPGGMVYVYSRSDHTVQAFNSDGTLSANWANNNFDVVLDDLEVSPIGPLFMPEYKGLAVIAPKRPELQRIEFPELVTRPLDIAVDPLGRVYVLNEEPRRLIMFRFWK
ncbi:MAG: hypothetical protein E3J72_11105 [Planctomycetota bacterium]|nr:MAG: hypothetical protein E3J72_11105 [Planctomycetota bacterium]